MDVDILEVRDQSWVESQLRKVSLLADPTVTPYGGARIRMAVPTDPSFLAPPSFYVLNRTTDRLEELEAEFNKHLYSIFAMTGDQAWIRYVVNGQEHCITAPVVEQYREQILFASGIADFGWLPSELSVNIIADGMHRCWLAKRNGIGLAVWVVERLHRVPDVCPYYAYPTLWENVLPMDERPQVTKRYRPGDPKSLYRDFSVLGSTGRRVAT